MTILALEFSSDIRSVAVVRGQDVLGQASDARGRSTRAFAMIDDALRQSGLARDSIEAIAVGLGPGSSTGIRVGLSIAQAWELVRGVKLTGLPTIDCLADQLRLRGDRGVLHVVVDGQRGDLYHATYELFDDAVRPVRSLHLASFEKIQSLIGNEPTVGWDQTARQLPHGRDVSPEAGALGRLAGSRRDFVPGPQLEPIHLRETQFVKAPPPRAPIP